MAHYLGQPCAIFIVGAAARSRGARPPRRRGVRPRPRRCDTAGQCSNLTPIKSVSSSPFPAPPRCRHAARDDEGGALGAEQRLRRGSPFAGRTASPHVDPSVISAQSVVITGDLLAPPVHSKGAQLHGRAQVCAGAPDDLAALLAEPIGAQVRETPCRPSSWANLSPL